MHPLLRHGGVRNMELAGRAEGANWLDPEVTEAHTTEMLGVLRTSSWRYHGLTMVTPKYLDCMYLQGLSM